MADNSQDLFSDQNFDASNFDSNGGPGPVPKKKYTASGKLITDKTQGVVTAGAISNEAKQYLQNQRKKAEQIQANAAQKQKQKEVQQYAPTNIVDEDIMSEVGETKYLEYQKDKERLDQLKDKQFSTLIGKNFESFRKTLSDVDTRENDGDPLTYLLNVGKDIIATTASAVGALAKAGYDKYTKNQFTEKEEIEFEKLNTKVNQVAKPVLQKQRQQLQAEYDKVAKTQGIDKNKIMYNTWSEEEDLKYKLANNYEKALSTYDDAIENTGFWGGLVEDRFGMLQTVDDVERGLFYKKMKAKEEAGETISANEEALLKSYIVSDRAVNGKLNSNKNYELGKGLRMSLEFMGEMWAGGNLVNSITENTVKKAFARDLINVVATPVLQPSTYGKAALQYSGSMQMTEDINGLATYYLTDDKKKRAVKDIDTKVKILNSEIEQIKANGDTSEESQITLQQKQLQKEHALNLKQELVDEDGKLRTAEVGFGTALAGGYVENLKEGFTEKFVGQGFDKVAGKLGKVLTSNTGKVGSKLGKLNDFLHTTKGELDDALFNNTAGKLSKQFFTNIGPAKVLHSVPAEMFEEIAINFLPSVGGDYGKQLEQLGEADFYSTVAAQTLIMGGGTQALANGVHYTKMWANKEYRDEIKEKNTLLESLKQQYRGIDRAISDDVLAKDISMSTLGTIHQVVEYQERIADLRNPKGDNPEGLDQKERNKKADLLERNSFINIALQAVQTGTQDDLKRSLTKLSNNNKVSEETRKNAAVGIESLKTYENILNKNKDLINSGTVIDLEIRKSLMENTIGPVAERLEASKEAFANILDKYNEGKEEQLTEGNFNRFLDSAQNQDFRNIPDNFLDFIERHGDKKAVKTYMDNSFVANNLDKAYTELKSKLDYQTDPANRTKIEKEIKEKQNVEMAETVTPDTAETVKEEINKTSIDPVANNKIDEKVSDQHKTHPVVEEDFGKPEKGIVNEKVNLSEFFGDTFEPTPAEEVVPETPQSEQEILLTGQELFAPVTFDPKNDAHKKQVQSVASGIKAMKAKNPNVNFDGLVSLLRSNYGSSNIEQSINIIAQAWNQSTQEPVSEDDVQKVYEDNFGSDTFNRSMFSTSGINEVVVEDSVLNEIEKSEESIMPEKILGINPVTGKVGVVFKGYKIAEGNVKVALLGVNYNISEDGTTYETVTNELNPSSFPVLHWENFKTGDKVPLGFKWDYLDIAGTNPMRVWRDNDSDYPKQVKTNIKAVVESIFGADSYAEVVRKSTTIEGRKELLNNEDFLKIMPTAFTLNGNQIEVGINDYHWWNAANTALPTDETGTTLPEARSRIIEAGRAYNLATRKAMASSPNLSTELEVSERREGFHNKLLPENSENFNSLENAFGGDLEAAKNKIGIVVVGKNHSLQSEQVNGKPVIKVGDKQIFTTDIRNFDAWIKSMEETANGKASGKVAMITQSGIEKGKPVYTIHSVINNHHSQAHRFNVYNSIHDQIEKHRNRYQKLVAANQEIPADLQAIENGLSKFGLTLNDTSTYKYFKKFYTERRQTTLKTKEEVDAYNAKVKDPAKYKKIGDNKYVTSDDVTDVLGNVSENMFRQDYDPQYSNTKRAGAVIDILDMESPEQFFESLLAGNLKTTDYKSILLKNLHTPYIFNKVDDGVHDPIYTTEVQPIISFNNNHLGQEGIKEVSKKGIDITSVSQKITQEKIVLNKQLENEKAELESTEDENSKQRIEKRIATIEKKIDALPAVTVQPVSEPMVTETTTADEINKKRQEELDKISHAVTVKSTTYKFVDDKSGIGDTITEVKVDTKMDGSVHVITYFEGEVLNREVVTNKERIADIKNIIGAKGSISELQEDGTYSDYKIVEDTIIEETENVVPENKKQKEINAKYDAELAALTPSTDRQYTDSDLIDVNNELLFRVISKIDISQPFTKLDIANHLVEAYDEFKDELTSKGLASELLFLTDNEGVILGRTTYDGSVIERIDALLELNQEEEVVASAEFIKDQNKESFENNMIQYLSGKVRMLMAGIPDTRGNNDNFPGTQQYMPFPQSVDALQQILSVVDNNTLDAVVQQIDAQVAINPTEFGFYNEIKNRLVALEKSSPDTLNEILYFLYQPKTEMIFLGYESTKDGYESTKDGYEKIEGRFKASKYDANSKNASIIKQQRWEQQLKNSPMLTKYEEGYYKLNTPVVERATALYDNIKLNKTDANIDEVSEFLSYFGISLNPATLQKMKDNEFKNSEHTLYSNTEEGEAGILKNNGLLDYLKKNLDTATKEQRQLVFNGRYVEDNTKQLALNLLTYDTNNVLKSLIKADNLVSFIPMQSMYIAGKMINSYQQPKSITNTVTKLLNDEKYLKKVKNTSITSESLIVELLTSNPELKDYFDVVNISLEAVKKLRDSSRDDMGITNLSEKDQMVTTINLFAHNDGKVINDEYSKNKEIELRKGTISFPTPSDSSQLPMVKTVLLDIQKNHLNTEMNRLNDDVLGLLFDKMILPELRRVSDSMVTKKANIKGYNTGAKFVTSFGSLNTLLIPVKTATGTTIQMPLIEAYKYYGDETGAFRDDPSNFYSKYRKEIFDEIQNNINQEVDRYVNQDGTKGSFIDNDIYEKGKINYIDSQYLTSKTSATGLPLARLISYDYVVNYMLTQRELQTLFAGDVANYFKDNMAKKLSIPTVDLSDIAKQYYPELLEQPQLLDQLSKNLNSPEAIQFVTENYPELLSATTTALNSLEQRYIDTNEIVKQQVADMLKDVQNNLSKRLKELVSPGNKFPNSGGNQKYYQVMLNDVDSSSETLQYLMDVSYPGQFASIEKEITEFKELDNIYESNRTDAQKKRHNALLSKLTKQFPIIGGYFKNASTDAQEYTTWRDNLGQLKSQGRVTTADYKAIYDKLSAQEKDLNTTGSISENNMWKDSEKDLRKLAVMQPTKPLYSGLHYEEIDGRNVSRYIYIKSSSFPLLPELTAMFPKLEGLRKSLSNIEEFDSEGNVTITARASYDSANKVGAVSNAANINDLYSGNLDRQTLLDNHAVELDRNNFFIQQDKPFKSDKNADAGKLDTNNRATQFEKIILGDGINKIEDNVFPNKFDKSLLNSLEIEVVDGMINGPALTKIYNEVYRREQALKNEKLLNRFGIANLNGLNEGNVEGMKELIKLMKERLNNKQDKEALDLLYEIPGQPIKLDTKEYQKHLLDGGVKASKAMFKIPIYMMPNSKKFESVLNSVINKNNINLKLPGFSSPVASQEGFDFKGYSAAEFEKAKANGLIVTKNFDPSKGLQSSRTEDGKLKHAQVFIANKYKIYNSETNTYDYIDLKQFINENGVIDTNKLPEELLSMFSFRIPTSSHQSGALIEIAGFLPHTSADLMIVPKDHTTQIGEDYDIDTRYVYQYNYFQNAEGQLRKMSYDNLENTIEKEESERITEAYKNFKNILADTYFGDKGSALANSALAHNRETMMEIADLQNILKNWNSSKVAKKVLQEKWELEVPLTKSLMLDKIKNLEFDILPAFRITEEYNTLKDQLTNEFYNRQENIDYYRMLDQKGNEEKILENNLISLYKTVYSTQHPGVQSLITKVLSTDNAGDTAAAMDKKIKSSNATGMYNIYSPHTQSGVMRAGASGKIGIGEHSNAVTANSLFQQSEFEHRLISHFRTTKEGETLPVYFNVRLGGLVFDGVLGRTENNGARISELGMEDQNSATDNQKLEIMDRRNENSNTMTVLKILHANGIDKDGVSINGKQMSYASLFINQPIIRRYSELMNKYKSSTTDSFGDIDSLVEKELIDEFGTGVDWKINQSGKMLPGKLSENMKDEKGPELTSKKLWDSLIVDETVDNNSQWYVYEAFRQFQSAAKKYNEVQQFINIEKNGMGVSYFDTIALTDKLINFYETKKPVMSNQDKLFGDHIYETNPELQKKIVGEGYIRIKNNDNHFVKPNTHYAHKIINSISNGYNLYNSLFPYDHKYVNQQIAGVFASSNINPNTKAGLELKYKIISNLKDYVYSNNKTLFDGNFDASVNEIFFDNNITGNQSLASYLIDLQKNPEYNRIFRDPFFKDLQFDINEGTFPSLIKFNNSDISTLNNLDIHNIFLRMLGSDKKLPDYNGKPYTNDLLLKDLFKYSVIGDQGNGAIGFRHLIPLKVFDKYNVSNTVRNSTDVNNTLVQNIIYNGPYKALESLLNNTVNADGIIENRNTPVSEINATVTAINKVLKDKYDLDNAVSVNERGDVTLNYYNGENPNSSYVKQFYQHNPKEVAAYSYPSAKATKANKLQKLLETNGFTLEMLNEGKVTNYFFEGELYAMSLTDDGVRKINSESELKDTEYPEYVKKDFMSLKDKAGKILLFEKKTEEGYYEQIPTLGVFGFNEYQVGRDVEKSKVEKNNPKTEWRNSSIIPNSAVVGLTEQTVTEIIDQIRTDKNGPYAAVLDMIAPLVDYSSVEIIVTPELQGNASYTGSYKDKDGNIVNPVIKVNQQFLESGITKEQLQANLTEEIIHHATVTTFNNYINFTGIDNAGKITYEKNKDSKGNEVIIPSEILTLIKVYQESFDTITRKQGLEVLLANINKTKSDITENKSVSLSLGDATDAYRVSNIHEFIAGVFLKNSDFAKEMANTKYLSSEKSILEKFTDTLVRLFNRVLPNKRTNTISAEVVVELNALLNRESIIRQEVQTKNKLEMETKKAEEATKKADNLLKDFNEEVTDTVPDSDSERTNLNGLLSPVIVKEGVSEVFKDNESLASIEPEQIHILGSKKDVEGFKDFVNNNTFNPIYSNLPTIGDSIPFIMPNGDNISLKILDETNDMYIVEFPNGTKEEISPMELGFDSWETSKGLKRASTIKKSIWKDVSKNFQSIKYNTDNLKNSKFSSVYNKIKNGQEVVSQDFTNIEEFKEFVDLLKFTYKNKELPLLYHGSVSLFSNFKEEFLGKYTGAPSAKQAFFAAKDLDTAASYGVTEKHYYDSYEEALERYEDQYIEEEFDFQSSEKNYAENKAFKNETYADYEENTVKVNTNIYPLFFISDNTLISDVKGNRKNIGSISKVLKDAKEENYDSVIFKDIYDGGFGGNTDVYTIFNSKQILNIFDLINSQSKTLQNSSINSEKLTTFVDVNREC